MGKPILGYYYSGADYAHAGIYKPCHENSEIARLPLDRYFIPATGPEDVIKKARDVVGAENINESNNIVSVKDTRDIKVLIELARVLGVIHIEWAVINNSLPDIAACIQSYHHDAFVVENDVTLVTLGCNNYILTSDPDAFKKFRSRVKASKPAYTTIKEPKLWQSYAYEFSNTLLDTVFGNWEGWRWKWAMFVRPWPQGSSLCAQTGARLAHVMKIARKPRMTKTLRAEFAKLADAHDWALKKRTNWAPLYIVANKIHRWITGKPLLPESKMKAWRKRAVYCRCCKLPFNHQGICYVNPGEANALQEGPDW